MSLVISTILGLGIIYLIERRFFKHNVLELFLLSFAVGLCVLVVGGLALLRLAGLS